MGNDDQRQRTAKSLHKAREIARRALQQAIAEDWHQGDYETLASHLDLPVMTLDNIMRSLHVGPYDRRTPSPQAEPKPQQDRRTPPGSCSEAEGVA